MKVSLIAAVYNDVEALDIIIKSLRTQTYKNFEFVIAEDGNSNEIKSYLNNARDIGFYIKHTFQEDKGIRKTRSLNNAILTSSGEYLIFIDGDCIPYSTFIEGHIKLAEQNCILSGRRVNLGPRYSSRLRQQRIKPLVLEKTFLFRFPFIFHDAVEKHAEEGFYFDPSSFLYKNFIYKRNANTQLLGCNYSCSKKDIIAINGYDEGYGETSIGDDTDLQWRFEGIGLKIKSCRNVANIFHLYHDRSFRSRIHCDNQLELFLYNKKNHKYFCDKGLNTH